MCILGGAGNHARPEIADDIVSAVLKTRADKYNPAIYWPREEQEKRLDRAFKKWAARGAWNMAAAKVSSSNCYLACRLTCTVDPPGADEAR